VLLDGVATLFTDSYEVAVPVLQRAHRPFDAARVRGRAAALEMAGHVSSIHLWDDAQWELLAERT
jgi:hypothetical protein